VTEPSPRCALVVDDDGPSQVIFNAMLRRLGFDAVATACDGKAAIDACRDTRFDLVLMDSLMPGIDGFEATRRIRADERARGQVPVPIIGTSALQDDDVARRAFDAGMTAMLHKPVRVDDLRSVVDRTLPPGR